MYSTLPWNLRTSTGNFYPTSSRGQSPIVASSVGMLRVCLLTECLRCAACPLLQHTRIGTNKAHEMALPMEVGQHILVPSVGFLAAECETDKPPCHSIRLDLSSHRTKPKMIYPCHGSIWANRGDHQNISRSPSTSRNENKESVALHEV